jgi:tetratricopeptide (TPR) repeat protein
LQEEEREETKEDPQQEKTFREWFIVFLETSTWTILYSSRLHLDPKSVLSFSVPLLDMAAAKQMFQHLWRDAIPDSEIPILETLLGELEYHPLTIDLISAQKENCGSIGALYQEWKETVAYENLARKDARKNDPHSSLKTALRMSYNAVKGNADALTLWGMLHYYPGKLPKKLLKNIAHDHFSKRYREAAELLTKNSLIKTEAWSLPNEDCYTMLAYIRSMAFAFYDDQRQENEQRQKVLACLHSGLVDIYDKAENLSDKDSHSWHIFALECLPSALGFLKQTSEAAPGNVGHLYKLQNYFQYASVQSLDVLRAYEEASGNRALSAYIFWIMGNMEFLLGKIGEARKHYAEAEERYGEVGEYFGLANVLTSMGDLERRIGEVAEARKHYAEAKKLFSKLEEYRGFANVLLRMGDLERIYGKGDESIAKAREHYAEAEKLFRKVNDDLGRANVLQGRGHLERKYGKGDDSIAKAREQHAEAEKLFRELKTPLGLANALQGRGHLERERGDIKKAIAFYSAALPLYEKIQDPLGKGYGPAELCRAYALDGNCEEAKHYAARAQEACDGLPEYVILYIKKCIAKAEAICAK